MSAWPSAKARRVLAALKRIGWRHDRTVGSHKIMKKEGWREAYPFSFHDSDELPTTIWRRSRRGRASSPRICECDSRSCGPAKSLHPPQMQSHNSKRQILPEARRRAEVYRRERSWRAHTHPGQRTGGRLFPPGYQYALVQTGIIDCLPHSAKRIALAPIAIALIEEISDCLGNQLIGCFIAAAGDFVLDLFF